MNARRSDLLLAIGILCVMAVSVFSSFVGTGLQIGGEALASNCWMTRLFDLACPFCGMSRSFVALGHGNIPQSLAYHPGGILLFTLALAIIVKIAVAAWRKSQPISSRRFFMPTVEAVSLLCVGIGILRTLNF